MNAKDYLKSKEILISGQLLFNLLISFYMISSYGNSFYLVFTLIVINVNFIGLLIYDYWRFKRLINNLSDTEACLDQKFLIKDVQTHHMGYEEEQIYDVLDRIVKSQYQIIKQKDFEIKEEKEYRTIWIHDLKQPLAILKEDSLSNYQRKSAVDKISKKLNYMLYYDKIDNIAEDLQFAYHDLGQLINECIREQAYEMVMINGKVKIDIPPQTLIYSDKFWLQFIIEQILNNAIKYADANRQLELECNYHQDENYQYITIVDNGIGIPAIDLKNIFDKGYRGINSQGNHNASGLGLYYVKIISEHLGAAVKVESNEDVGINVSLIFPMLK